MRLNLNLMAASRRAPSAAVPALLTIGTATVVVVMVWQAIVAGGNPDPLAPGIGASSAVMNTGIVVFREGLEAILVLAALTASLVRKQHDAWKPIALGAVVSLLGSIATWFIVVRLIDGIGAPALHMQAATGVLAIVVLLVILNWFFHKIYWTGWISLHEKRKRALLESDAAPRAVYSGLFIVGLTAVYREGFEVVLFLQSIRLQVGNATVGAGVSIGLFLTMIVAILTFVGQRRLPFKQLLVATGVMIVGVLLVMVGASGQAMQQAGWLPTTSINMAIPEWVGAWFGVYPTVEGLSAQAIAAAVIVGSYVVARRHAGETLV